MQPPSIAVRIDCMVAGWPAGSLIARSLKQDAEKP
jgi:hypothetical protein